MSCVAHALVILITLRCAKPCATLRRAFTRQPLLGYRCVTDNAPNLTTLLDIDRAQCVWRCLSSYDCVGVSHNHRLNYCELSRRPCDRVMSDEDFSVNVYGIDRKLCLQWVPESEFDGQKAVMMKKDPPLEKKIAVARMNQNSGLYPGRQNRFNLMKIKIAVDENTFVLGVRGEVLLMDESCVWAWIPYASSDNLPVGAVVGGYDVEGLLYIARNLWMAPTASAITNRVNHLGTSCSGKRSAHMGSWKYLSFCKMLHL